MGFRIENYTRDELRKIALPGNAVSTLFWVLPIGKWRMGDLDRWWDHFTKNNGHCQRIGLLLVRDLATSRERPDTSTANLMPSLTEADGGSLMDLIPELSQNAANWNCAKPNEPALLVLAGAYPQPGWGVFIPLQRELIAPLSFERLISEALDSFCTDADLKPIYEAAETYHLLNSDESSRPKTPKEPSELVELKELSDKLGELFNCLECGDATSIRTAFDRLSLNSLQSLLSDEETLAKPQWDDLSGCITMLKGMSDFLANGDELWAPVISAFDSCPEEDRIPLLRSLDKRQAAFIKKFCFLRKQWPNLKVVGLSDWMVTVYRPHLITKFQKALGNIKVKADTQAAESMIAWQNELRRYDYLILNWMAKRKAAELTFRSSLVAASLAQWKLGPRFLIQLEKACQKKGMGGRSVSWDQARMTGWKLHAANLGIEPNDLLVAAHSVIGTNTTQFSETKPTSEFNGSLFADYAYFVAMSAERMSPWQATRRLLTELLNPGQLRALTANTETEDTAAIQTKDQLAETLLQVWGWSEHHIDKPRSLAACIGQNRAGNSILSKSLNDTRISLESFLKDLLRMVFSSLGWRDEMLEEKISIHCPNYKRSSRGAWFSEMRKITSGGALILLRELLQIAFPSQLDKDSVESLCQKVNSVLVDLNKGSHDPPLPPPSDTELRQYADTLLAIMETVRRVFIEMPWHLRPSQTFGTEPVIATGHAWSHSHSEEKLIRVMLWAGDTSSAEMLVWNRSLSNPVMTDATLI